MAREKVLKVKIIGDSKSAEAALSSLSGKTLKLGTALKAGLAAAGVAVGALVFQLKQAVSAAAEQEKAELTLAQAMQHHGTYTQEAFEALKQFAAERQRLTKYGDDLTLSNLRLLQTYGMDTEMMKKAMVAAQDLASAKGIDLTTAVNLLGKAYGGNTTALARHGIKLDEARLKTEGFSYVLEELNKHFGGAAQAEADTYTGRLEQMKNAFGDLQEVIGFAILPALKDMVTTLRDVFASLQESGVIEKIVAPLADAFSRLAPIIGNIITSVVQLVTESGIFTTLVETLTSIFSLLAPIIEQLGPPIMSIVSVLANLFNTVLASLGPVLEKLLPIIAMIVEKISGFLERSSPTIERVIELITDILVRVLEKIEPHLDRMLDLWLRLLEGALQMLPPILEILQPLVDLFGVFLNIIIPITEALTWLQGTIMRGIGAALNWLAGVVTEMGNVWQTVWGAISGFFSAVWNGIKATWDAIVTPLISVATTIWDGVKTAWDAVWGAIRGALRGAWNFLKTIYDTILAPIGDAVRKLWDGIDRVWDGAWSAAKRVLKTGVLVVLRIAEQAARAIDFLNPFGGNLADKVRSAISAVEAWHSGGWIPGRGEILLPLGLFEGGEFVVPRRAAERLGPEVLEMVRRGMLPAVAGGGVTINVYVESLYGDREYVDMLAERIVQRLPVAEFRRWGRV